MNIKNNCPFESAKIEIITLCDNDIIVTSNRYPYEGEGDLFPTSWSVLDEE